MELLTSEMIQGLQHRLRHDSLGSRIVMANLVCSLAQPIQTCFGHRLLLILLLSTSAGLSGLVPGLTPDLSQLEMTSIAYAQDLLLKVDDYAKAVLQMEPLRIKALNEVQEKIGPQTPKDVCRQSDLPSAVQTICTDFFNQSAEIIRLNGLSNLEFNQITEKVQTDTLYRQRLDAALLEQAK
jgi:hypothetical protein